MALAAHNQVAYEQTRPSNAPIHLQRQHQNHLHRTQNPQSDAKRPAYLDDEDTAVILDAGILDADIMQSPTQQDIAFRKDSFAQSAGVLPNVDSQTWDQHYPNGLPMESSMTGFSANFNNDPNGYGRHHSISGPPSHQHPSHGAVWSLAPDSGHCTPAGPIEGIPSAQTYDNASYVHQRADSAHASFSHPPPPHPFNATTADSGFIPAPQVQTPMSPHSHQDWMGMAQQEMEGRPGPRQMRPNSPARTMVDLQRRDGIRKKNGRIDIPQERNIHTIDQLIETTKDEDMLKELKQQKRLLRNREAALQSRQRKKKHTEDLETKEKGYSQQISMLEQQVEALGLERDNLTRDRQILVHRTQEADRIIETFQMEKRDMLMKHTEETSNLRKRIQVLTDRIDASPAPAMSANPSSTGFSDFTGEMDALNIGPHEWDSLIYVPDVHGNNVMDEFGFEQQSMGQMKPAQMLEKKASTNTIVPAKKTNDSSTDQPIASSLLFMLLLCGAFVASKPATSSTSDLPKMPPDVRAAAPTVLNSLLSDGSTPTTQQARNVMQSFQDPAPSNMPQPNMRNANKLDQLHQRLTSPSKQQEQDAAFAMTQAQYESLMDPGFPMHNDRVVNQPRPARRNLAEALANPQTPESGNKAEVYTRSLLFDQIPADVVKQFKEMVRDREARDQQEQQQQQQQHFYKVEA
ncbi:hypothetical protein Q7P37_009401 [Cladosporium fusiforme]